VKKLRAVAIDGPAGAGKSTVARRVASLLDFTYVDTGAMYRAVAWKAREMGVPLEDGEALAALSRGLRLEWLPDGRRWLADGADITRVIRTSGISAITRYAARSPGVRTEMARRQKAYAAAGPVVMEGRDIGLAVLPDARWKFFMTASPETRAKRRWDEMRQAGSVLSLEEVLSDQAARDKADDEVGPLRTLREKALAGDGVEWIDTTGMDADEVAARMAERVRRDEAFA